MKAVLEGAVLAEADAEDVVEIEGNQYFPPTAVDRSRLVDSPTPYRCPWKGDCQYFSVRLGEELRTDAAWSYPNPKPSAIERVGRDFAGFVTFDPAVRIER